MTGPDRMKDAVKPVRKRGLLLLTVCMALALCGCARKVELSGGTVKDNLQSITAVVTPEDLEKLDSFEQLGSADFTGSSCYAELADWTKRHPLVEVTYTVEFPNGTVAENDVHELDLTGLKDADAEEALENLEYLPQLKSVDLGSDKDGLSPAAMLQFRESRPDLEFAYHCQLLGKDSTLDETKLDLTGVSESRIRADLDVIACLKELKTIELGSDEEKNPPSWKLIRSLREAAPDAKIRYRFTLYDMPLTLEDEEIDISYHYVADAWPEVLEIAECMPNLKTLLMDTCAVGNEDMLGNSDVAVFKYFTKMKYLDLGHNELITDLSFARYMPDLEVLIIAMNPLGDLSPLADCPKLEYLELFYSMTDDLSPLAGLKNLKHLNVGPISAPLPPAQCRRSRWITTANCTRTAKLTTRAGRAPRAPGGGRPASRARNWNGTRSSPITRRSGETMRRAMRCCGIRWAMTGCSTARNGMTRPGSMSAGKKRV